MSKVFISYSRKDIDFARKLAGDLESAGYDVWWDITDLRGGDDWVRVIPEAIKSSQYVIVVLTPDSIESDWVRKEYTQALSLRKKIIPVMLVPCSVPFALNTINFVNFASGEYEDNFKKLLSPLGYTGRPPDVKPYRKPIIPLPPGFFKFGIPILIGLALVAVLAWIDPFEPTPTPKFTPTHTSTATDSPTATNTLASPTSSSTATASPTQTFTSTPTLTVTWTASPTPSRTFPLPICIYYYPYLTGDWVRERPNNNTGSRILGALQRDGTNCPFFSAYIENQENEIWYQFASDGQKAEFEQYAGRWIFGHSSAAVNPNAEITLPLCIYSRSVETVIVFEEPSESSDRKGNSSLEADGTNCPFFNARRENEGKVWYQFVSNGQKAEFEQYVEGWISGEYLALPRDFLSPTIKIPAVTLTSTPTPSNTPTITPSHTPSSTPTATPSPTATNTFTSTPTNIPTLTATTTNTPTETTVP